MKLEENIEKLNKLIEQYQNTSLSDGNTLIYLAQQIAGLLYWLSIGVVAITEFNY